MFYMLAKTLYLLAISSCASTLKRTTLEKLKKHLQGDSKGGISVELLDQKQVNISMLPMSISNLNAAEQTFTFNAGFSITWFDRNLAWNKTDYDDITKVAIAEQFVWIPAIAIPNGIGSVSLALDRSPVISNTGIATLPFLESLKTSCQIDISLYPFDQQRCSILFMPANHYKLGVHMSGSIITRLPHFFIDNSEWELVDIRARVVDVKTEEISSLVSFEFFLKRKSMFYIVSIIFPMALLSLLNACVFLLPADSGEKMSYLISIFVSYAVFMNFVNDSIPKSGDVCRLSVYLTLILCQSCLAIITNMATLNVRNNSLLQPANDNVNTDGTERPHEKSASKVRRANHILFGVFVLLALVSLLVFCV